MADPRYARAGEQWPAELAAKEAFARLAPRCQQALRLRYIEGHTIPSIARILDASARELAGVVVEEFRHAQLNERALHAVAYLRETADIALPASARHVATYLRRLKDEPALLFIEPESRG